MIAAATENDAEAVVALWRACGLTRPWNDPHADFARAVQGAGSAVLVYREGARIVGSAMVGGDGHRGWVYYLAVAPDAQRRGHGRALMAAAEAWLRARGLPKVQLMVREGNEAALGFYAALGFEVQKVATLGKPLMAERA